MLFPVSSNVKVLISGRGYHQLSLLCRVLSITQSKSEDVLPLKRVELVVRLKNDVRVVVYTLELLRRQSYR